jgi:hypothetical protein
MSLRVGNFPLLGYGQVPREKKFAVAVRYSDTLFLIHRIRRSSTGEIFHVTVTGREDEPEWSNWTPHESYHKDGKYHLKSFDHKFHGQQRQKPDASFQGTECIVRQGISAHDAQARNVICHSADFHDVFEIPAELLRGETGQTVFALDVTDAGGPPVLPPGSKVIVQKRFDDDLPEILVTVFVDRLLTDPPA